MPIKSSGNYTVRELIFSTLLLLRLCRRTILFPALLYSVQVPSAGRHRCHLEGYSAPASKGEAGGINPCAAQAWMAFEAKSHEKAFDVDLLFC